MIDLYLASSPEAVLFSRISKMKSADFHPFYGMRKFSTHETCCNSINCELCVLFQEMQTKFNFQHNCHTEGCCFTNTRRNIIKMLETTIKTPEHHNCLANLPIKLISPDQWLKICQAGLCWWGVVDAPVAVRLTPPAEMRSLLLENKTTIKEENFNDNELIRKPEREKERKKNQRREHTTE
ncbi:hypothetical protein VP01_2633g1 [Puccinia sorghi]|uniref:Uncharacterized protein n=1 Tax=Puccinia sorghi TaxID=27349 RepID=A0A0L6V4E3_9BASI|nr:hypothetical protein VP01_2633g1 [Puccinia sorghi]